MLLKLLVCHIGVFTCFLLNGMVMETITKTFGKKILTYFVFLVLIPCFFNFTLAHSVILVNTKIMKPCPPEKRRPVPKHLYFISGALVMFLLLCSNGSLAYVETNTHSTLWILGCKEVVLHLPVHDDSCHRWWSSCVHV